MSEFVQNIKAKLGLNQWKNIEDKAYRFAKNLIDNNKSLEWLKEHHTLMVGPHNKNIVMHDDYVWNLYIHSKTEGGEKLPEWQQGITGKDYDPTIGSPIVLYNAETDSKEIIKCDDYNLNDYPKSIYTPIGIVVIPKYHMGIIKGNENAVDIMMSLKHMRYSNPNNGGSVQGIYWGDPRLDIPELFNYTATPLITNMVESVLTLGLFSEVVQTYSSGTAEVPILVNEENYLNYYTEPSFFALDSESSGIEESPTIRGLTSLPSDKFNVFESLACPGIYYISTSLCCPSPFLLQKGTYSPNSAYYLPWNDNNPSVTSDFNGKENTNIIISKITVANWKVQTPLSNSTSTGNYPAAACCWRYSTIGTNLGDWYLPAAGELGYIMPFFNLHMKAINTINSIYGSNTATALGGLEDYYCSSSEKSGSNEYVLDISSGHWYNYLNKSTVLCCVIAFCEVR